MVYTSGYFFYVFLPMLDLLLTIFATVGLTLSFKFFEKYKIDTLQAIAFNYGTAMVWGYCLQPSRSVAYVFGQWWFWFAVFIGLLFVSVFIVIGLTTQRVGVSVVAMAGKMSLAIPVLFGVFYYGEPIGVSKILGIVVAVVALVLATYRPQKPLDAHLAVGRDRVLVLFPLIIFFGSGLIDICLAYSSKSIIVSDRVRDIFFMTLFGSAFFWGVLLVLYQFLVNGIVFRFKNLVGGVILGSINYASTYFLSKAVGVFGASVFFPLNNIGVIVVSAILAYFLFNERLTRLNFAGLCLALVAIGLIGWQ